MPRWPAGSLPVHARLWQMGRWLVLGAGAALVELALLRGLIAALLLPAWAASALAAETLILARFLVADRWVFHHARPDRQRLLRYQGASMGALVVSLAVFNGLTLGLGAGYTVAFVCGSGASFIWSLLTNFLWVWQRSYQPTSHQPVEPSAVASELIADS